jgi:UDP-N-acetylmuramyl pentapeptide phosphotransferase/UDP-N-acetylglucosamine-1-phosphate transferase
MIGAIVAGLAWTLLRMQAPAGFARALAAVVAVAVVGWIDDHRGLSVPVRFGVHLLAGLAIAICLAPLAHGGTLMIAGMGAWWIFWSVAAINVVNFIDGIDGIIASQVIVYALYLMALTPRDGFAFTSAVVLASASVGFIIWNWQPAKIFMGDVGSGALGALVVLCGGVAMAESGVNLVTAFLPLAPIFLDATVTIVRRARNGEKLTVAHRSHLYQRLCARGWSHAQSSTLFLALAALGAVAGLMARNNPIAWLAYGIALVALYAIADAHARRGRPEVLRADS